MIKSQKAVHVPLIFVNKQPQGAHIQCPYGLMYVPFGAVSKSLFGIFAQSQGGTLCHFSGFRQFRTIKFHQNPRNRGLRPEIARFR